jgi:hypothetical protein
MTNIMQRQLLLWLGTALSLSACGNDPKAANDGNFEKALNAHYAVMKQCIRIGSEPNDEGIIQEYRSSAQTPGGNKEKEILFYNGLVDLGLLEAVTYQRDERGFSGQVKGKADWVGYKFSEKGKSYLRPANLDKGVFSTGTPQLCYGARQVVEITNFTEPAEVMGVKASTVQYTYKIVEVEPWAKEPIFSSRYDWLPKRLSDQNIEADDDLVLTNNGWVHHSTFKQ